MKQLGPVLKDEDLAPGGHRDALEARLRGKGPQGPGRKPTWGETLMVKNSIQNVFKTKPFTKY